MSARCGRCGIVTAFRWTGATEMAIRTSWPVVLVSAIRGQTPVVRWSRPTAPRSPVGRLPVRVRTQTGGQTNTPVHQPAGAFRFGTPAAELHALRTADCRLRSRCTCSPDPLTDRTDLGPRGSPGYRRGGEGRSRCGTPHRRVWPRRASSRPGARGARLLEGRLDRPSATLRSSDLPIQSWHHSHTLPCMSYKPHALGFFCPTGCVFLDEFALYQAWSPNDSPRSGKLYRAIVLRFQLASGRRRLLPLRPSRSNRENA
jgi:hypothetical protein